MGRLKEQAQALITAYEVTERRESHQNLINSLRFDYSGKDSQLHDFARSFIATLADSYLILVVLDEELVGQRFIIKFAYDEEELTQQDTATRDLNEVVFTQEVPDPGFAASQHVEVCVPDDLEIGGLWLLWGYTGKFEFSHTEVAHSRQRIAHVSTPKIGRFATAKIVFALRPTRDGLQYFVTYSTWTVVALVIAATTALLLPDGIILEDRQTSSSSAVSLLLVAPALMFSWIARTAENLVVSRTLFPLRFLLVLLAVILLMMAGAVAVPLSLLFCRILWLVVMVATFVSILVWALFCRYRHRRPTRNAARSR